MDRIDAADRLRHQFNAYKRGDVSFGQLLNNIENAFMVFMTDEQGHHDIGYWLASLREIVKWKYDKAEKRAGSNLLFERYLDFIRNENQAIVIAEESIFKHSLVQVMPGRLPSNHDMCIGCMSLVGIVPIAFGFESFFVDWGIKKEDVDAMLTMCRSSLCFYEESTADTGQDPSFFALEQNRKALAGNLTHWHSIVANGGLRLPLISAGKEEICLTCPIGTFIISDRLGSLLGYPFVAENVIICPIYSGWINKLESLYIVDLNSLSAAYLTCSRAAEHFFTVKHRRMIEAALLHLIGSQQNKGKSSAQPRASFLIGQRINFGHTIIQDSTFLGSLSCLDPSVTRAVIVGKYDYLCTIERLKFSHDQANRACADLSPYQIGNDVFSMPNHESYPVPTYRPLSSMLPCTPKRAPTNKIAGKPIALYLHVDERTGTRKCLNYVEIAHCISEACTTYDIPNVILDSLTALPDSLGTVRIVDSPSNVQASDLVEPPRDYVEVLHILRSLGISVQDTHGLSLLEKIDISEGYLVKAAITSYGSSMMFPIYLLNCPIVIFGHELHPEALGSWRWHTTRLCFDKRQHVERWSSSSVGDQGYRVNISSMMSELREAINACVPVSDVAQEE